MKRIIIIIFLILIGFGANAQTGYLVQPAKWKFTRPQWLDSGAWIKNLTKYGGQERVLVYDSVTNKIGYKYITNGATYTAGRGLTLNSNTFRLDTTQFYTWTSSRTDFNSAPPAVSTRGLLNLGSGAFDGLSSGFFSGNSNGSVLAINTASGFAGDLMNLQVGGVSKFKVTEGGAGTFAGSITASSATIPNSLTAGYIQAYSSPLSIISRTDISATISASGGSTVYNNLSLSPSVNQTGGANGITRGLYINPTLTAAADFRAIEYTVGATNYFKVDNIGNVTAKNGKLSGVLFTQTATATVANTTTETTVTSTGSGSLTLPANFFEVGKSIVIHAEGVHSATANPDITVKIKIGGTTYLTTGTVVSGNSTNAYIEIKGTITCRTTGASGTVQAQGFYMETGAGDLPYGMPNTTTQTIDTTTTQAVDVTIQWGTASASNTISITNLLIEGKGGN